MEKNNEKFGEMIPERSGDERAKLFDHLTNNLKFKSATAHRFLSLERAIAKRQRQWEEKEE